MKKIISCVLAGAVMLGLSACAGGTGTAGVDASTEAVQSESETTEEATAETSEESTSGETTVLPSKDSADISDVVIAESESKKTDKEETNTSVSAPEDTKTVKTEVTNANGDIIVDLNGKGSEAIGKIILSAKQLKANETVESYAKRFSITPETSHVGNLWSFDWPESKLSNFSIRKVQIRTKGEDFVIDDTCDVIVVI